MRNWLVGIALTVLVCLSGWGCVGESPPLGLGAHEDEPVYWHGVRPCNYQFSVEPGLRFDFQRAVDTMSYATGCPLEVVPEDGIPVYTRKRIVINPPRLLSDGRILTEALGATIPYLDSSTRRFSRWAGVEVMRSVYETYPDSDTAYWAMLHELFHVLGVKGHTPSGIGRDTLEPEFTEDVLVAICSHSDCTSFNLPETL